MNAASNGFLLSLSLCMDIGIVNIAMITLAMQRGYWPGFWLGVGSCIGDMVYASLALAGATALLRFETVRWAVWVVGGTIMIGLTVQMALNALRATNKPMEQLAGEYGGLRDQILKGLLLALSSPSAIIWFAVVGGALIAKSGNGSQYAAPLFLGAFFAAGLVWTAALCALAHQGGQLAGPKLLRACHAASALLFAYLAYQIIADGYKTLLLRAPSV